MLDEAGFPDPPVEQVLVQTRDGVRRSGRRGRRRPTPSPPPSAAWTRSPAVGDPVPSADGTSLLVPVTLDVGDRTGGAAADAAADEVGAVLDAVAGVQADHPGLLVTESGDSSLDSVVGEQLDRDFQRAELLSLPVTLLVLLVAFGALLAAGVPVLLGITAVGGALGLVALVSQLTPGRPEHLQRRAADRHGRRGRLRAVLRPPGAGGTPATARPPQARSSWPRPPPAGRC